MTAGTGDTPYPLTNFNFLVELTIGQPDALGVSSPMCNSEFAECDGLDMTMEPKTLREGGNNTSQIHLVGPVTYGNLSLKRGMTSNQDLWKWFITAAAFPGAPTQRRGALANAEITMLDAAGSPQVIYRLFDCLPIKLKGSPMNAKDGVVAIEEMQIAYSYFTIDVATE